jgi:CheY-like chemotaxis protein
MSQALAGVKIFVVEDDDDSREILAHALTLEGATVTAVSAAREAWRACPRRTSC